MDIPVNAHVDCSDGTFGRSTYIVLQPNTHRVTHVVVRSKHGAHTEYLVPVELVDESTADTILLRCSRKDVEGMDVFADSDFTLATYPETFARGSYLWPGELEEPMVIETEHLHVPPGETALTNGAQVNATDGPVGEVEELLIDPTSGQITHLVLREGHLWRHKNVSIPVSAISRIDSTVIYLKFSKQQLLDLPKDQRHYMLA